MLLAATQRADLRVGIGEIEIDVDDDVTVEIRHDVHDGDVIVDGAVRADGTFTVGPEGEPDVIVDAEISLGDIDIERYDFDVELGDIRVRCRRSPSNQPSISAKGCRWRPTARCVLPDGVGAIGPNGELWSPYQAVPRSDGVRVITQRVRRLPGAAQRDDHHAQRHPRRRARPAP